MNPKFKIQEGNAINKKKFLQDVKTKHFLPLKERFRIDDNKLNELFKEAYDNIFEPSEFDLNKTETLINSFIENKVPELFELIDFELKDQFSFDTFGTILKNSNNTRFDSYEDIDEFIGQGEMLSPYHKRDAEERHSEKLKLIDLHGNCFDGDSIDIRNLKLRHTEQIDTYLDVQRELLSAKFTDLGIVLDEARSTSGLNEDMLNLLREKIDLYGYECLYLDEKNKDLFFSCNEGIEKLLELMDENLNQQNNIMFLDGGSIITGSDTLLAIDSVILLRMFGTTSVPDYIHPKNAALFFENVINETIDEFKKYNGSSFDFSEKFESEIPDSHKKVFIVLLSELLTTTDLPTKLKDILDKSGKLDFYDVMKESLNELFEGQRLFSKNDVKSLKRGNYMELISECKSSYVKESHEKFPLLSLYDPDAKNFIFPLNVTSALSYTQNNEYVWDEDIFDKTIQLLESGTERKSDIDYGNQELNNWLKDTQVYETDELVTFEWDGINELMVMGAYPQPSCQNLLMSTGYNHKLLAHAHIPYTKLLLSFTKPEGYVGIDFTTKEIITEDINGNTSKSPLQIENRTVVVIGDSDEGVRLRNDYGTASIELDDIHNKLLSKYGKLGKSLREQFKKDSEEWGENWFYIE